MSRAIGTDAEMRRLIARQRQQYLDDAARAGRASILRGSRPPIARRFEVPQSLPQATIDNAKLNRAIGRAASMTDSNYHQEARRVLSRAFGYDDLTAEYGDIIREHERAGYLTQPLSERVDQADNEMFRRIRMQYGADILRRVYRGL